MLFRSPAEGITISGAHTAGTDRGGIVGRGLACLNGAGRLSDRKGDKSLESIIALAPLLGLLGTVLGLIRSLSGIKLGDLGTSAGGTVTLGISESLISTATGMIVAIVSLGFYRLFQSLIFGQINLFRGAGNQLELLYREHWLNIKGKSILPERGSASDEIDRF